MDLSPLDPVIHQPTRLRIMALLYRNRQAAFTWLRDTLGLTDGNLGSHGTKLEDEGLIETGKVLTPAGFQVRYRITHAGDTAFRAYLAALQAYLDEEAVLEGATAPDVATDAGPERKTL